MQGFDPLRWFFALLSLSGYYAGQALLDTVILGVHPKGMGCCDLPLTEALSSLLSCVWC